MENPEENRQKLVDRHRPITNEDEGQDPRTKDGGGGGGVQNFAFSSLPSSLLNDGSDDDDGGSGVQVFDFSSPPSWLLNDDSDDDDGRPPPPPAEDDDELEEQG
ncbi:hypothetical protein MPTK1_3g12860 [Marchantia polymorpha subsp. ruderalis]|nr:hypothetical protein MARPO_0050s0078 [Marchantia polymorpha]BBN05409.1 hypothetical protein Mp_3g12860 [Marchantia polymorpha subsp. ruderalis]|eukprot:PTQ38622.1 hypothetical protein MARPO_0050s0078 [Marchantia polymorpha]